jgi:hypothetical protein
MVNTSSAGPRATTTKKSRPQSSKPASSHVIEPQPVRGGSMKRDLYTNSNNFGLSGSSSKNKQKTQPSSTTSKQLKPSSSEHGRVGSRKTHSQDPRDKGYNNIVQYGNYVMDEEEV